MTRTIHDSLYLRLELVHVDGSAIVRATRTGERFPSLAAAGAEFTKIASAIERERGGATRLLFDLREARPRNDEGFERLVSERRRELFDRFERLAFIVRTEVGRLQLTRHIRLGYLRGRVFRDEREALASLLEG